MRKSENETTKNFHLFRAAGGVESLKALNCESQKKNMAEQLPFHDFINWADVSRIFFPVVFTFSSVSFFFGCWVEKKARKEKKRIVELNLFRCETLESILVSLLIFSTNFFLQFRSIFHFPFFTVHWTNRAGHRRWLNAGLNLWFIHIKLLE